MSEAEDKLQAHVNKNVHNPNSMTGLADSALQGVTVSFLAQVFRTDPAAVKRKLVNCKILESRRRGTTQVQNIYDLATAAAFLVEKDIDLASVISKIRKEDLPPSINGAYWAARLARQKFEENAGDLWRTSRVWDVLSGTFQTMKFTIDLWAETIERQVGITDDQRELIMEMSDKLKTELHTALVDRGETGSTGSQLSEVKVDDVVEDEDDEAIAALI